MHNPGPDVSTLVLAVIYDLITALKFAVGCSGPHIMLSRIAIHICTKETENDRERKNIYK